MDNTNGLPHPDQSDTRMQEFWNNLDPGLFKPKEPPRDLDVKASDVGKAVGAGALSLVGGIGELAGQVSRYGNENADIDQGDYLENARAKMAKKVAPVMDVIAKGGAWAQLGADQLTASMSDDAREAMQRNIVGETPSGSLTLGDGAGDIDVWAMKFANGIGSMLPTMGAGAVTSLGRAVTLSMIKRGASQEIAEAVAARTVHLATAAATTTGVSGSVGSTGQQAKEAVQGMSFDQLKSSDIFREAFRRIDSDQQTAHLSATEKLDMAREETANAASQFAMGDAKTWGAAAVGTMMGDTMLFKMLAGKGAGGGMLRGMGKGAAGEGVSEALESGTQQYVTNQAQNEVAGANIDPMQGVTSAAIEGGVIGAGVGGAVGGVGGMRGNSQQQEDGGAQPEPQAETPVDQQAAPVTPEQEVTQAEQATAAPEVSPNLPQDQNPLGPSASQFDPIRDEPAYLRQGAATDNQLPEGVRGEMPAVAEPVAATVVPMHEPQPATQEQPVAVGDPQDQTAAPEVAQPDTDPLAATVGPLQSLRVTRKGKPFATEKEAALASRRGQEMPVPLNGGGFGVAQIAEVQQVQAQEPAANTESPMINTPADQPVADVSAETVTAPVQAEASQIKQQSSNPEPLDAAKPVAETEQRGLSEEDLKDRDLLKEHAGRWKYRSSVGSGWFTANTKEGAVERAQEAYRKAMSKGEPVPTRDERFAQANEDLFSEMDRRYGRMSMPELQAEYQRLGGEVTDLQMAGKGEFNGNGGRRTGAAVSNEGARQTGEERLRLGIYMKMRQEREGVGNDTPAVDTISSQRQGDQPDASQPVLPMAEPSAGDSAGVPSADQAGGTAPEPAPTGSQQDDQTLTAPATDAGVVASEPAAQDASPMPWSEAIDNPDGSITLKGDLPAIREWAKERGVTLIPGKGGVLASASSASKVREHMAPPQSKPAAKNVRMSQERSRLSADDVARIVSDFRREYKGTKSLDFIVGQTQEDLYGPEGSPERIGWRDGGYLPGKQQVHLIADSISRRARSQDIHQGAGGKGGISGDPILGQQAQRELHRAGTSARAEEEVVSTLRHEVLGHYGLDTFTPSDKSSLLQKLIDARHEPWLSPTWEHISQPNMYGNESEQHQAEEVFAKLAEKELPSRSIRAWNDIKTLFSRMLRNVGIAKGPIKEHELDSLIRAVGKGIRNGERTRQNIRGDKNVIGNPANEPAKTGQAERIIKFSKQSQAEGTIPAKHLTRKEAELVTKEWLKQYHGVNGIDIQIHATQAELEQALGLEPKEGLIRRAAFDRDESGLHVSADTISNPRHLREILRHEVLAHYGLANVLGGGEYTNLMARIIKSRDDSSMRPVWDWVKTHYGDEDIGVQAEEVVAHLAELEPSAWRRGWDKVVNWVTQALRKVGFLPSSHVSAAEIRSMIEALGNKLQSSKQDEAAPDGQRFSQKQDDSAQRDVRLSQTVADSAMDKLSLGRKEDVIDRTKARLDALSGTDKSTVKKWVDRFIKKANTEMLDALAPIKYAEDAAGVTDASDSGYVAARLASGSASTMQATMLHGLPEWKDGVIQRKAGTGESDALLGIFEGLGKDLHNWLGWMAGHRAEILMKEGRENLLTPDEITALKALDNGKEAQFQEAKKKWNAVNKAVLDLAEEAGLFTKADRANWESEWYIPFFRESEDGDAMAPFKAKGLANQSSGIKKLKGGTAHTADLLENIFASTGKLIDASMKNMAAQKVVWNLSDTDIIEVVPKPNHMDWKALGNDQSRILVKVGGEDYMIKIKDPDLYRAMTFFDRKPFGKLVNFAAKSKHLLTAGVTASPEFMLRNFMRDSLSAWAISKDGFTPIIDSIKGVRKTLAMDGSTLDVMFSGASFLGGYVNGNDPGAMADSVRKALRRKGMSPEQITRYEKSIIRNAKQAQDVLANAWDKYAKYGEAFENANREAVYDAAIKAGKSHAQAAFEAKDLMDFSMLGASRNMQRMVQLLPFFNARVQGLGKLARELRDNPRAIAKRAGMITAASLALMAINWDDERYQDLPDWDKDANWHFFLGDAHWRIPKPFEIGVMFATIPERMVRAIGGKDTGEQFGKALARSFMDTFALNPMPQVFKPLVESYYNYDTFRGAPIENMADLAVRAEARYNENTSLLMREIGQATGMSPKKLEHLMIGYTGTIGSYVMATADGLIRWMSPGESAGWRADEIPVVKAIYRGSGPAKSTQQMDEFYQMMDEVGKLKRTVDQYRKEGMTEEAQKLLDEQGGILRSRANLTGTQKQIRQLRNEMELIQRSKTLTSDQKRERLDKLMARRNKLVADAVRRNRPLWDE